MAKRITTKGLSDGLKEAKENAEGLLKAYDAILNDIKESADVLKKNKGNLNLLDAKEIEKLNKLFEESNDLVRQKKEVDDQQIKIKKQLNQLTDEEIKGKLRFQKAAREQKQLLEAELILQQKQIRTLKDLREQNKALKIARDQLDFERDAEQIAAYNAQIDANTEILKGNSDAQTQLKFNIGNYREEVSNAIQDNVDLKSSFGKLGAILGILQTQFVKVKESQKNQNEQTDENVKGFKKLSNAAKFAGKALLASGIGILIAGLGELIAQFKNSREGTILFQKTIAKVFASIRVIGGFAIDFIVAKFNQVTANLSNFGLGFKKAVVEIKDFFNSTKETRAELDRINKSINNNNATIKETTKALEELSSRDLASEIKEVNVAVEELVNNQFKLGDATKKATIEIAQQRAQEERLLTIADDDTRGFNERTKARDSLLKILRSTNSATKQAEALAEKQLKLQRDSVAISLKSRGISDAKIQALLAESSLTKALIADQTTLGKLDNNVLDELADAETNFIEKRAERTQQLLDVNQTLNKVIFDEVEQVVDFLIDGNEQLKVSNEKLINDESKDLETRKSLLKQTQELITESNRLVREEIAKTVDGLSGADIGKAFDEAISPQDLNERLKALGLAEIPIKRLLELFKETQAQTRDFAELSKSITEAEKEAIELREDIEAQTKVLNDETITDAETLNAKLDQLEKERFDNKVQRLRDEIKEVDDNSLTQLRKQQELNDLLLAEEKRKLDEEKSLKDKATEEEKKRREEEKKFARETAIETTEAVLNSFIRESEARQDNIKESISDAQNRRNELVALSASTNSQVSQLAADSLAQQRAIEREKTIELEKEKRRQIRLETVLAGLQAYSANAGQPNAAGKTIADVGVLLAGLSATSGSFFEGTDRLLGSGKGIDNKGGMLNINHPDEMIIQKDLVKEMGYPSRYDVADVFKRYKDGDLVDRTKIATGSVIVKENNNSEVVKELKGIKKAVKNSASSGLTTFDAVKGALKYRERNGNRVNEYIDYVR